MMDSGYLMKQVHEEFVKRIEDEEHRQNKRLDHLEKLCEENNRIIGSIEKLALNMESMQKEQKKQGERLEVLESRDGEKWRKAEWLVITGLITGVIGYVLGQIGL